jgi:hypothetical protein
MAPCVGNVLNPSMYWYDWSYHEQIRLQVYAVSILFFPGSACPLNVHQPRISLKHVAEGGTLAEEVISTVRTAQAFGAQKFLSSLYDKHIEGSRVVDSKAAIWHGGGLACFFFVIYSAYALAFDFGTTLINEGHGKSHILRVIEESLTCECS